MVPCDNWQLSLITRQGLKISLRKWPALWDVVQRLNKDKSIHLRKLLRKRDKGASHRTAGRSTFRRTVYRSAHAAMFHIYPLYKGRKWKRSSFKSWKWAHIISCKVPASGCVHAANLHTSAFRVCGCVPVLSAHKGVTLCLYFSVTTCLTSADWPSWFNQTDATHCGLINIGAQGDLC